MKYIPLKDVCKINMGQSPDSSSYNEIEKGIPFFQGNADFGERYPIARVWCNAPTKIAQPEDILISVRAPIGALNYAKEECCIGRGLAALTPDKNKVSLEFIYWLLKGKNAELNHKGTGSTFKAISRNVLEEIMVPVVDYEKQHEYAEILEKIYTIIHKRKEELHLLDNLIKARFVEMFGEKGKVVPLTDYVWFQEGPGVRSVDFTSEGTILLTGSNINDNELSFGYKSDRFISDELACGKYAHFMCDKDDILVVSSAIAPEKFDKKVIIVEENKKYCLNTGIIRFKPNKEVLTLGYFREFLKTDYFKHQVMAEMRGIAQMHFGPSHLKQMTILLPDSMEQQVKFELFVKHIDKSKFVKPKRAFYRQ